MDRASPHLPHPAPIEAYGGGGFRFAGMSHRGSLLCLPNGIWPSPVTSAKDIAITTFDLVFAADVAVELCLIGTGRDPAFVAPDLRAQFRERGIAIESMTTGAAVRTYNILLGENRRVAALLIAPD